MLRWTKIKRKKAVIAASIVAIICFCCYWVLNSIIEDQECSDVQSRQYLKDLCTSYSGGLVTGSLCLPLCVEEIKFTKCVGHGVKPHVLTALWRGTTIVMKAVYTPGDYDVSQYLPIDTSQDNFSITKDRFFDLAQSSSLYPLESANQHIVVEMLERVIKECDIKQDNILYLEELKLCWLLITTEEYSFYQLLQGNSAIPVMLGTCGHLYAVQYSPSELFLGFLTDWFEVRSWEWRVRLALGLLEMVEALENTAFGTVYLCDVQESNFGVVKKMDGTLSAKAIDMDISFFEQTITSMIDSEKNNACTSDKDCKFYSCQVSCNERTQQCSGVLSSNNLKLVCLRLFLPVYSHQPALLLNPPEKVSYQLNNLLEQCIQSISPHIDFVLVNKFRTLLLESIT